MCSNFLSERIRPNRTGVAVRLQVYHWSRGSRGTMACIIFADRDAQELADRAAGQLTLDKLEELMTLPTDSGRMVLEAWEAAGPAATQQFFDTLMACRWKALFASIVKKADPIGYLGGLRIPVPDNRWQRSPEYTERYYSMVATVPMGGLAQTWRSGACEGSGKFVPYPKGRPGEQAPAPKKSKRIGTSNDAVQPGELYPAPDDEIMRSLRGEEVPSFLASTTYKIGKIDIEPADLPKLQRKALNEAVESNYAWLPLARRVDIDRVFASVDRSAIFDTVQPCGSLGQALKINPWSHMSPYKIAVTGSEPQFSEQVSRTEIGITDEGGTGRESSSGARLYVMGPPRTKDQVLLKVAALLLESDFDSGALKVELKDRRVVDWGAGAVDVKKELNMAGYDGEKSLQVRKELLLRAMGLAELSWPLNSEVRVQLAAMVAEFAVTEVDLDWQKAVSESASVSRPTPEPPSPTSPADVEEPLAGDPWRAVVCDQVAHPPAPGWHDAGKFPELAEQQLTADEAQSLHSWVSDSPAVVPASSSSGPAQAPLAGGWLADQLAKQQQGADQSESKTATATAWADQEDSGTDDSEDSAVEGVSAQPLPRELALEGKTTFQSLGLDESCIDYMGMNMFQAPDFVDLIAVDFSIAETDARYETLLSKVHGEICSQGPPAPSEQQLLDSSASVRRTLRNLVRRRRDVLKEEQKEFGMPDAALANHRLSAERVEHYMRLHRRAFEASQAQRIMVEWDRSHKIPSRQRENRMASRFNTMLLEHYGGRVCIRSFLRSGELVKFRVVVKPLPSLTEAIASGVIVGGGAKERNPIQPQKFRSGSDITRAKGRARYLDKMVKDLADPQSSRPCVLRARANPDAAETLKKQSDRYKEVAEKLKRRQQQDRQLPPWRQR